MSFRERIVRSSQTKKSRIVLALDFGDPYDVRLAKAEGVLAAVKDEIAAVKVNHHLLLPYGLRGLGGIVEACKKTELPLIADLKINDIEATNINVVDSLLAFGFDGIIANPFVGKEEGLGKAIEKMHSKDGGVILLVYMSHKGADEGYSLKLEGGDPLYRVFARRAKEWGGDGVVVSAKSPDIISEARQIVGRNCLIFSPGVGAQGGSAASGIGAGADFAIVGRSITGSPDPLKAVRQLNGE